MRIARPMLVAITAVTASQKRRPASCFSRARSSRARRRSRSRRYARWMAVRSELEGSRIDSVLAPLEERAGLDELPRPLRLAAERVAAVGVLQLPVRDNGSVVGSVELMRSRTDFDELQLALARAAAEEVAL